MIQQLQLPPLINVPQLDQTALGQIGDTIAAYRQRSAVADSLPTMLGQQPQQGTSLATLGQPQQPQQPGAGAPSAPGNASAAIGGMESGGNYSALGPVTPSGDRAYGKYQVMGANIPQWTQDVLGHSLTPQQFLASPQAQDAVFQAKFGQLAQKFGPVGAAKAWFAGPGGMNNPNATDQNGTTVGDYAQKFQLAYSGPNPPMPSAASQGAQPATSQPGGAGIQPSPASAPQPAPQPQQSGMPAVPAATMARIQAMIRAGGPAQQFAMALLQRYVVPQFQVLHEGDTLVNPITRQVVAQGMPKAVVQTPGSSIGFVTQGPNGQPTVTTAGGNTSGLLTDQAAMFAAQRLANGGHLDRSEVGYGAVGALNAAKIANLLPTLKNADGSPLTPQQMNLAQAQLHGLQTGEAALGTQEAKVGSAAMEAGNAIALARGAINNVSRTNSWGPLNRTFNQLQQLYDEHRLNPAQTQLYVRAQAVINTYATVMSRNGVPSDAARAHAEELLPTDGNPATWNTALDTLTSEINMAKTSPGQMKALIEREYLGRSGAAPSGGASQPNRNLPTFETPQEFWAARKAGKIKAGDQFMTADGQLRIAK